MEKEGRIRKGSGGEYREEEEREGVYKGTWRER